MIMVIFLVLGYCPLRNVLCSLAGNSPQNNKQKAPRDIKAVVEDCSAYNSGDKIIPYQEVTAKTAVPLLLAVVVAVVFFTGAGVSGKVTVLYRTSAGHNLSPIPLYLANRALLI
ncbi:hypothetical protein SNE26_17195 [Mucilaginibacter sp. cycad4]|uniref:hypothetical protein n=1 Tax=Mucilaginibacter sp. cycad4 TaxID=3342096 RepID=UPI002AAC09D9|nr:hypothetical protein [Mucilaginibacter gossypii]WPU97765.1 hypothetical protein SNE26_17195 [Mucilaginibacter gossypii]